MERESGTPTDESMKLFLGMCNVVVPGSDMRPFHRLIWAVDKVAALERYKNEYRTLFQPNVLHTAFVVAESLK